MSTEELWDLERRFWLEGTAVYEAHLDPGCVMVFPGIGIMESAEIIPSLEGAPRWDDVEMTERVTAQAGGEVVVLAYRAAGVREGAGPYHAFCTSTYRRDGGGWKLLQHQQTPAG